MGYAKAILDLVLAAVAYASGLLADFGGEKWKTETGPLWKRITRKGWFSIGLGFLALVIVAGQIVIGWYDEAKQASEREVSDTRMHGQVLELSDQLGPFIALAEKTFPGVATKDALEALLDRFDAFDAENTRLRAKIRETEAIRSHEDVARWGFDGMASFSGGVARIATPVAGWANGRMRVDGDKVSFLCDSKGVEGYRRAIKQEPRFPLPYLALAECQSRDGNPLWRDTAEKGIAILELTTKVPDHDPNHDSALARLRKLVQRH